MARPGLQAPTPPQNITDFLLSLLAQESAFTRRVVNEVFPHLCHSMSPAALGIILKALVEPFAGLWGRGCCVSVRWANCSLTRVLPP